VFLKSDRLAVHCSCCCTRSVHCSHQLVWQRVLELRPRGGDARRYMGIAVPFAIHTASNVLPGSRNDITRNTADKADPLLASTPHAHGADTHHLRSHREASMTQPSGSHLDNVAITGARLSKAARANHKHSEVVACKMPTHQQTGAHRLHPRLCSHRRTNDCAAAQRRKAYPECAYKRRPLHTTALTALAPMQTCTTPSLNPRWHPANRHLATARRRAAPPLSWFVGHSIRSKYATYERTSECAAHDRRCRARGQPRWCW
jgi:hypothetical protein